MPALKTYDLFISHAWRYNAEYYRLISLLNNTPHLRYRNYSVPEHDPVLDPDGTYGRATLTSALDRQIRPVNCVLIISGMYAAHRYWIQKEIEIASSYAKPIIGILPWGQERIPSIIDEHADVLAGWNTDSIVSAIRRIAI